MSEGNGSSIPKHTNYTSNIFKHIVIDKSLSDVPRVSNLYSSLLPNSIDNVSLNTEHFDESKNSLIQSILLGNYHEFCHILNIRDQNLGYKITSEIFAGTYEGKYVVRPDLTVISGLLKEDLDVLFVSSRHGAQNALELAFLCEQYVMVVYMQLLGFDLSVEGSGGVKTGINSENTGNMLMKLMKLLPMSRLIGNRDLVLPDQYKNNNPLTLYAILTLKSNRNIRTCVKESTEYELDKWVKLLQVFQFDFAQLDEDGNNAQHLAVQLRMPTMVRLLLEQKLDVHQHNKLEDSPLTLAVKLGYPEIAEQFSQQPDILKNSERKEMNLLDLVMYMQIFHQRYMNNVNESITIHPQQLPIHTSFFIDRMVIRDLFFTSIALDQYTTALVQQLTQEIELTSASKGIQSIMSVYLDGILTQMDGTNLTAHRNSAQLKNTCNRLESKNSNASLTSSNQMNASNYGSSNSCNSLGSSTQSTPLAQVSQLFTIEQDQKPSKTTTDMSILPCIPAVYCMNQYMSLILPTAVNMNTPSNNSYTIQLDSGRNALLFAKTHLEACVDANISSQSQIYSVIPSHLQQEYKNIYHVLESYQYIQWTRSEQSGQEESLLKFLINFFTNTSFTAIQDLVRSVDPKSCGKNVGDAAPSFEKRKDTAPQLSKQQTNQQFNIMHPSWDDAMRQASVLTRWKGEVRGSMSGDQRAATPIMEEARSCPIFHKSSTNSPIMKRNRERADSFVTAQISTSGSHPFLKKPRLQNSVKSLTSLLLDPNNDPTTSRQDYSRSRASTTMEVPSLVSQPHHPHLNSIPTYNNTTPSTPNNAEEPVLSSTLMDILDINALLSCATSALQLTTQQPKFMHSSEASMVKQVLETTSIFQQPALPLSLTNTPILATSHHNNNFLLTFTPNTTHKNDHLHATMTTQYLVNFNDPTTLRAVQEAIHTIVTTGSYNQHALPHPILFHSFSMILLYCILITVHTQLIILHKMPLHLQSPQTNEKSMQIQALAQQVERQVCDALLQHGEHPIYSVIYIILTRASEQFKRRLDNILTGIEQGMDKRELFNIFIGKQ